MENRISNLPVYRCKVCKKKLESKFDLKVHIDKEHPDINQFGGIIFPLSPGKNYLIGSLQFHEKKIPIFLFGGILKPCGPIFGHF